MINIHNNLFSRDVGADSTNIDRLEMVPRARPKYGSSEKFCNTTPEEDAAHETWSLCHALELSSS